MPVVVWFRWNVVRTNSLEHNRNIPSSSGQLAAPRPRLLCAAPPLAPRFSSASHRVGAESPLPVSPCRPVPSSVPFALQSTPSLPSGASPSVSPHSRPCWRCLGYTHPIPKSDPSRAPMLPCLPPLPAITILPNPKSAQMWARKKYFLALRPPHRRTCPKVGLGHWRHHKRTLWRVCPPPPPGCTPTCRASIPSPYLASTPRFAHPPMPTYPPSKIFNGPHGGTIGLCAPGSLGQSTRAHSAPGTAAHLGRLHRRAI